jgi:hypothetical protein
MISPPIKSLRHRVIPSDNVNFEIFGAQGPFQLRQDLLKENREPSLVGRAVQMTDHQDPALGSSGKSTSQIAPAFAHRVWYGCRHKDSIIEMFLARPSKVVSPGKGSDTQTRGELNISFLLDRGDHERF